MGTYVDFEGEKIKVFAIVDKTVQEYFWMTALELSRPGLRRVALSAVDPYMNTLDRLLKIWSKFGVDIVKGSQGRRKLHNPRRNQLIDVNFVVVERSPLLES